MELLDLPNELLLAVVVLIGGFDIIPCRLVSVIIRESRGELTGSIHDTTYISRLTTDLQTGARAHRP